MIVAQKNFINPYNLNKFQGTRGHSNLEIAASFRVRGDVYGKISYNTVAKSLQQKIKDYLTSHQRSTMVFEHLPNCRYAFSTDLGLQRAKP